MTNPVLARFERKDLPAATVAQIDANTAAYRAFAESVLAMAPAGRELSAALTALQEAKFWTNEAVTVGFPAVAEPDTTTTPDESTEQPA
ncbi:hypothetical protein HUN59_04660 [Curtobacterium sp. Csp2]|uniref:Acb2/Tad1 domain-containing protein n=1 Tax=Curtobacterium sp. Csp2 TaxID=2495430 RepID=UPI001580AB60|nr:hypothetical protein [Curtobacterium sp. Csp2]QKS15602.1 hypothetical protein HUN59_04660 [Curtobacterium sp. Csp2]